MNSTLSVHRVMHIDDVRTLIPITIIDCMHLILFIITIVGAFILF